LKKVKYATLAALVFCAISFSSIFVDAQDEPEKIMWNDEEWKTTDT
jgi:hypothetical protein